MFKKFLAVIMVVVLSLSVVGCTSSETADSSVDTSNRLETILNNGVMRVAMIPDNPGWSVMDASGEWIGYDADVARLIAESLGVEIEFVVTDGAGRVPLIQTDKVDIVISCFTATNERAKSVGFTIPYATSGILPLVKKDNMLESWDDLADKKISVGRGSTNDVFATNAFPDAEIVRFDSIADAFLAVKTGKVDVLLEEDTAVYDLVKNNPETAPMDVELKSSSYICMGVAQENQIWANYVNHVIQNALHSGKLSELYKKSFNKDLPEMVIY